MKNKKKILLTNHYSEGPYRIVREELPEGFALEMLERNQQDCLAEAISQVDYLLASGRVKVTTDILDLAPKLKCETSKHTARQFGSCVGL